MATLPSPRQLLTSLLTTLTTAPITQQPSNLINEPYSAPRNSLKDIPASQRGLLTTLHLLFPPPMLLQALDLLDRGLVMRVVEKDPSSSENKNQVLEEEAEGPVAHPPQASIHLPICSPPVGRNAVVRRGGQNLEKQEEKRNSVYQVRSSQSNKSRFRDSSAGAATGSMVYTVRLKAWNCSCAAFAFSMFPATLASAGPAPWNLDGRGVDELRGLWTRGNEMGKGNENGGNIEEFGGLSLDGSEDGGSVPVCKHLVACLLGERWDVLWGYVREREVSREEMGGVGAEG